jgi:polyhydroxybutyrate depolymerase
MPLSFRRTLLACAFLLAAPAAASAQAPPCDTQGPAGTTYATGVNCRSLQHDGDRRRYEVYVPAGARRDAPVVFMFHGGSGDGERFLKISGWREQADATGLIAVFPTGERYRITENGRLQTRWNVFGILDEIEEAETPPADDVGFVDAILTDLQTELQVDAHRIYASGFSNGAGMAARLAVERSQTFAAVAFSGGGLGSAQAPAPRALPTYSTLGSLDDRVLDKLDPPLPELPMNPRRILANPVLGGYIDVALGALGLPRAPSAVVVRPHRTTFRWPARRPLLTFAMLEGLEHKYPTSDNNHFDAASEFWAFFSRHRLP